LQVYDVMHQVIIIGGMAKKDVMPTT
jgi:hypothetical protein